MIPIQLRGLTKAFSTITAVDDLTVEVAPGRVTGFLGRNGAGKTTTMRILLALERPSSGEALIDGKKYADLRDPRRVVGAVLDPDGFHPGRRGRDHLRVVARSAGIDDARVDEVLDLVGLTEATSRRVGSYSLGMRQRLAIATALLGNPEVLVLDEPANGLDPDGVAWLRHTIRSLAADGVTVLVSSHLLSEVAQTVDDVIVINAGRLRYAGPLAGLTPDGVSLEDAFLRLTSAADMEVA